MRKLSVPFLALLLFSFMSVNYAQEYSRKKVDVPKVTGKITIDGKMNEADWSKAATANILTSSGSEGFFNKYYAFGEALTEPDYKEIYGRMLYDKDTLYLFYHLQEVVNDSMVLYFGKKFEADQVFVSLSNRQGIDTLQMPYNYNGAPYAAPDGPYLYFVLGKDVTLNGGDSTDVPKEYRTDSTVKKTIFNASKFARWAATIDTVKGIYEIEMAIYNPNIAPQSKIGFNLGGSNGQRKKDFYQGDRTYEYYCWAPSVPNDPYKDPVGEGKDPGFYNLVVSKYWPVLNFSTQPLDVRRENLNVTPSNFALDQNYPNPFNPSTTIRFEVPQLSSVTVKIYNVVGQVVATLVNNQVMSAGRYEVNWDASRLASGVYFYNLEAGNVHLTKKMMLLK